MSISMLKTEELKEFLNLYGRDSTSTNRQELINSASNLYNELRDLNDPNVALTNGFYDLVKAQNLPIERTYDDTVILLLYPQEVEMFANSLGIPYDPNNNDKISERITRILLIANLINPAINPDGSIKLYVYLIPPTSGGIRIPVRITPEELREMRLYPDSGIIQNIYNRIMTRREKEIIFDTYNNYNIAREQMDQLPRMREFINRYNDPNFRPTRDYFIDNLQFKSLRIDQEGSNKYAYTLMLE